MLTNLKFQISADHENVPENELARILRKIADEVESGVIPITERRFEKSVLDINGNTVGRLLT